MSTNKEDNKETSATKVVSKHKQSGKHSLKYDIIFKGKKEEIDEDEDTSTTYFNDSFTIEPSSNYYEDSVNSHESMRERELKQKIYDILLKNTEINFSNNRRKPSVVDFNEYYRLLKTNLKIDKYSDCQIFIELAYYFSDNILNMFKLLEPKWRDNILDELQKYIGKRPENSKEVKPVNLSIDAEIEFVVYDIVRECDIIVTGIIIGQNHEDRIYEVDSYENIYEVHIDDIIKILNNTKFKYNLNKLNNIDFI